MPDFTMTPPPQLVALTARLRDPDKKVAFNRAAVKFAPKLAEYLVEQGNATSQFGSNRFTQAWTAESNGSPGISIHNSFPKARFVEFATRPHWILPKKPGGSLSWVSRGDGKRRFAKKVYHPGFGGYYTFETTILGRTTELWQVIATEVTAFLIRG